MSRPRICRRGPRSRVHARTSVALLALMSFIVLGGCGSGDSGGESPGGVRSPSATGSQTGAVPVEDPSGAPAAEGNSGDGPWPCSLIPTASVAGLVEDPTLDDSRAGQLNSPTCLWSSQVNDGDHVQFVWDANKNTMDTVKGLGTPVGDLGDEAFYVQIRTNVGANLDRAVVQNRLFIRFGDVRVLLVLRSEDAALPQDLIAVGRALVAQCESSTCAKPQAAAVDPADRAAACGLLTASDLASAGLQVAEGETPSDKPTSCAFTSAGADKPSFFVHQRDEDFAFFQKNEYYEPLAGVGDGALIASTTIYFHKGGPVFSVVCAKGCTMSKDQLTAVARTAAGRL